MGKKKGGVTKKREVINYFQDFPDAKPAEVVAALARRGIEVSASLVGNTKSEMRAEARRSGGQPPAAQAPAAQAPEKSAATKTPTSKAPKKKAAGTTAAKKPAGRPAGQTAATPAGSAGTPLRRGGGLSADDLFEAKKLADELGGIEQARRALDYLERLR